MLKSNVNQRKNTERQKYKEYESEVKPNFLIKLLKRYKKTDRWTDKKIRK